MRLWSLACFVTLALVFGPSSVAADEEEGEFSPSPADYDDDDLMGLLPDLRGLLPKEQIIDGVENDHLAVGVMCVIVASLLAAFFLTDDPDDDDSTSPITGFNEQIYGNDDKKMEEDRFGADWGDEDLNKYSTFEQAKEYTVVINKPGNKMGFTFLDGTRLIKLVTLGSEADKAGMLAHSTILSINGKKVSANWYHHDLPKAKPPITFLLRAPDHRIKSTFELFEKNNDGLVDFEEFRETIEPLMSARDIHTEADLRDLFDVIDINGNDEITIHEWEAFLSPHLITGAYFKKAAVARAIDNLLMAKKIMDRTATIKDKDYITFDEFKRMMRNCEAADRGLNRARVTPGEQEWFFWVMVEMGTIKDIQKQREWEMKAMKDERKCWGLFTCGNPEKRNSPAITLRPNAKIRKHLMFRVMCPFLRPTTTDPALALGDCLSRMFSAVKMFRSIDLSRNGIIDKEEWRYVCKHSVKHADPTKVRVLRLRIDQAFRRIDFDESGVITVFEFLVYIAPVIDAIRLVENRPEYNPVECILKAVIVRAGFKMFDRTRGDGRIFINEFKPVIKGTEGAANFPFRWAEGAGVPLDESGKVRDDLINALFYSINSISDKDTMEARAFMTFPVFFKILYPHVDIQYRTTEAMTFAIERLMKTTVQLGSQIFQALNLHQGPGGEHHCDIETFTHTCQTVVKEANRHKKSVPEYDEKDAEKVFEFLDRDNNGEVTDLELYAAITRHWDRNVNPVDRSATGLHTASQRREAKKQLGSLLLCQRVFSLIDRNEDHYIDQGEFVHALNKMGIVEDDSVIEQVFKRLDADKLETVGLLDFYNTCGKELYKFSDKDGVRLAGMDDGTDFRNAVKRFLLDVLVIPVREVMKEDKRGARDAEEESDESYSSENDDDYSS